MPTFAKPTFPVLLAAILTLLIAGPTTAAPTYTAIALGTLGGSYSDGWDINSSGQVTGSYIRGDGEYRAYLYTSGQGMIDIGSLGAAHSEGLGINDSGQVTGISGVIAQGFPGHAFVYTPGAGMVDLGTFGGTMSMGFAINSSGAVTGWYRDPRTTENRAFIYSPGSVVTFGVASEGFDINEAGQVTGEYAVSADGVWHAYQYTAGIGIIDIGTLGGQNSRGEGINNFGQVVGFSLTGGNVANHAFLFSPGLGMLDLGTLGGNSSLAFAVNDRAQIAGASDVLGGGGSHAFIYTDGSMYDLNELVTTNLGNTVLYQAVAINDLGQIVATGCDEMRQCQAYRLDPSIGAVPEPATLALLGIGLAGLGLSRRKQ